MVCHLLPFAKVGQCSSKQEMNLVFLEDACLHVVVVIHRLVLTAKNYSMKSGESLSCN